MKKILAVFCALFLSGVSHSEILGPRISLFSTTVDWAAITGLSLHQYTGSFVGKNSDLVKKGIVLYYLDAFPCYGEADSVRVWISPKGEVVGNLRLVCIHEPTEVKFAWNNEKQDAIQSVTTGLLTCPVRVNGGDFSVDLSKCTRGTDWQEYK
ncbi:MAG: hypothetical protein MJ170_02215 [Alphaproteobacteria bacterium]|nr:hypothetical protein [Alphaproteobacteria bacterium]